MTPDRDALAELRYALAEADAELPSTSLRARVVAAALEARDPGRSSPAPEFISGAEALRRAVASLDVLLADLSPDEWTRPALRDLDVQGTVGHLTGVEADFVAALRGGVAATDHVGSTQPTAQAQAGRPTSATHADWAAETATTLSLLEGRKPDEPVTFYGITFPLDQLLVVRAFEMWIHEEDIRRATGRPLGAPDAARLARMAELAVALLPFGMSIANRSVAGRTARLVLTGAGGGTWDVALDGTPTSAPAEARVVVDITSFCRVVGNREDQAGSGAAVTGDHSVAADLFVGAAALALD